MARSVKSKSTESTSTPAAAAPVAAAASTETPKVKKVKKEKEVAAAAAPAPVVDAAAPAAADEQAVEAESAITKQSAEFATKLQQMLGLITALRTEYRSLEKAWSRDIKLAQKQSSKRKRKTGTRSPSGFVKPTKISDELATFLDKPTGSEMARTDVTRHINEYIRNNGLQDKENGRKIHPDPKLAKLLKVTSADELTYFNLQKFMSPHFAKSVKAVATA
jgi:upstream activation factor subunit UAF30